MLEIVHDLAPGAELLFASGIESSLAFVQAVECLHGRGRQRHRRRPRILRRAVLRGGLIAQAVRHAVAAGVSFHTAAGNSARSTGRGCSEPVGTTRRPRARQFRDGRRHGQRERDGVTSGGTLLCVLQWDDPFGTAGDDYDLVVRRPRGRWTPAARPGSAVTAIRSRS